MKLIFCPDCQDVRKLSYEMTYCNCRESCGRYVDKLNAEINKHAIPLGFNNFSLFDAVRNRSTKFWGEPFKAFVIQRKCSSVTIID